MEPSGWIVPLRGALRTPPAPSPGLSPPLSLGEGLCQHGGLGAAARAGFAFQGWFPSQGPLNLGESPKIRVPGTPKPGVTQWGRVRAPGFLLDKGVSSGRAAPSPGGFGLLGTESCS